MTNRITGQAPSDTLIVFDKDGVLLDLNATWLPAIVALGGYLERRCDGATSRDDFLAAAGVMMTPGSDDGVILENSLFAAGTFAEMRDVWQAMEPRLEPVFADIDTYRADVTQLMGDAVRGKTVPMGAVKDGIMRLKAGGYRLGVATNDNSPSAMINLTDLGIDQAFDVVICADSGFGRKPEAGGLLEACRATGIAPDAAIMVGDTATDYGAAEAAGYRGFVTISHDAPTKPFFIPRTDLVTKDVAAFADWLGV